MTPTRSPRVSLRGAATPNADGGLAIKTKIGVMGSAGGRLSDEVRAKCRELGRQVAQHNCIIITGACPGLPHEAVLGAREFGGLALGISPALTLQEHIDHYHSPYEEYDALIDRPGQASSSAT